VTHPAIRRTRYHVVFSSLTVVSNAGVTPMTGAYVYTPAIWAPLAGAIFMAVLGLHAWRRRSVPGALPFAIASVLGSLLLLSVPPEAAASAATTKTAWYKVQAFLQMLVVTGITCFVLEYTSPGRWLTRRNLTLLALPPLLLLLLVIIDDSHLIWRWLEVAPEGTVVPHLTAAGAIVVAYGAGLVLVNAAALLWLFARSPQHRWPVALMLFGMIASRQALLTRICLGPSSGPGRRSTALDDVAITVRPPSSTCCRPPNGGDRTDV
jgi:hypothetical protein